MAGLVVQCYQSSKSDKTKVEFSFNVPGETDNSPIVNQNDVSGITNLQASFKDGQLHCEWKVAATAKVSYQGNFLSFQHNEYFLLLATGPFKPGKLLKTI